MSEVLPGGGSCAGMARTRELIAAGMHSPGEGKRYEFNICSEFSITSRGLCVRDSEISLHPGCMAGCLVRCASLIAQSTRSSNPLLVDYLAISVNHASAELC